MDTTNTPDFDAQSRRNLMGLTLHATAFLVVGSMMFVTNLMTSPGFFWFIWPLAGWGIGIAMHTVGVLRFETMTDEEKQRWMDHNRMHRSHGCCGARSWT